MFAFTSASPRRTSAVHIPFLPYWVVRLFASALHARARFAMKGHSRPRSDSKASVVFQAAYAGDRQASAALLPLFYAELQQLALARLARHASGQTLTPTALVHEAYVRSAGDSAVIWEGRQCFYFVAARAMCDILVEQARRMAAPKHGGGRRREELDEACAVLEPPSDDVLAVDEALAELEPRDPLKAQIILLRCFTGLTMDETAAILGLVERTLDRHWRYIRAWLMRLSK